MTELERELQLSLQAQEKIFREKLGEISTEFKQQLRFAASVIERQESIILKQLNSLDIFRSASKNMVISLESEPLERLESLVIDLEKRLIALEDGLRGSGRL